MTKVYLPDYVDPYDEMARWCKEAIAEDTGHYPQIGCDPFGNIYIDVPSQSVVFTEVMLNLEHSI